MKSIYLLLTFCFLSFVSLAQTPGTFTIFAEDGDKFWLVVNGEKYNAKAAARVEAKDVKGTRAKIKVIFENTKLGTYDDAIYLKDFDNKPIYTTYSLRRKKDKWVMRMSDYEDATRVETSTTTTPNGNTTTTTTTTAPNTHQETETEGDVHGVNITMPGVNVKADANGNFDMQVNDPIETTTVVTTKTTTSKQTKKQNPKDIIHMKHEIPGPSTTVKPSKPVVEPTTPAEPASPSTNGLKPITATSYNALISNLKRQSFEETKLKMAKVGIKNNSFTTEQISGILKVFNFEQSKLDLAKTAYKNCSDKDNYLDVSQNFNFSSSTDELTEFLGNQ